MWRYSPGMHASGRDTCYCWTRHGWKSLFVLQVLPDRDTATHTCLHNVLRDRRCKEMRLLCQPSNYQSRPHTFSWVRCCLLQRSCYFLHFAGDRARPHQRWTCLLFCCAIAGRASCIVWPCYFLIRLHLALHSSLKITSKNAPCWLMCAYLIGK